MGQTPIEWTDDSENPIRARNIATGGIGHYCEKITPGCANCYSEKWQPRFKNPIRFDPKSRQMVELFLDEKLLCRIPHYRKPRKIFPCDMTDIFGSWVPEEWLDKIMAAYLCLDRRFAVQFLTKRADRMLEYFSTPGRLEKIIAQSRSVGMSFRFARNIALELDQWPLPHFWLGVSAENQKEADERIPLLLQTPAAVRWVSYEPALGPVDFGRFIGLPGVATGDPGGRCENCGKESGQAAQRIVGSSCYDGAWTCSDRCDKQLDNLGCPLERSGLDWIVAGGESGPRARPAHPDWFRSVRDQCQAAGVPFFFKQWGKWAPVPQNMDLPGKPQMIRAGDLCLSLNGEGHSFKPNLDIVPNEGAGTAVRQLGKKHAGRLLDGREWNEFPSTDYAESADSKTRLLKSDQSVQSADKGST